MVMIELIAVSVVGVLGSAKCGLGSWWLKAMFLCIQERQIWNSVEPK